MRKIAIIMGSDSDLEIVRPAANKLSELSIEYEMHVLSAHRTPCAVASFASQAYDNGFGCIIAAAGKAAHLAGAIAAQTVLPVIAIPISSKALGGMDALLSSVQMPSGIPVATVAIDGAANAAHKSSRSQTSDSTTDSKSRESRWKRRCSKRIDDLTTESPTPKAGSTT